MADESKVRELRRAAELLRENGYPIAADELDLAATVARKQAYQDQWRERLENDTLDLY